MRNNTKKSKSLSKKNDSKIKTSLQPTLQQIQSYQNIISSTSINVTAPILNKMKSQQSQGMNQLEQISSLLDVDNLENRVYCSSDRKLMIDGLSYHDKSGEEIIHSYYILPGAE